MAEEAKTLVRICGRLVSWVEFEVCLRTTSALKNQAAKRMCRHGELCVVQYSRLVFGNMRKDRHREDVLIEVAARLESKKKEKKAAL